MRVITTGWRRWHESVHNTERLFGFLDSMLHMVLATKDPILQLVHGGAEGADAVVHEWARANQEFHGSLVVPDPEVYLADWTRYGKAAGPRRNERMVGGRADLAAAFVHPESKGTVDCMVKLAQAGIYTLVVPWEEVGDVQYQQQPAGL